MQAVVLVSLFRKASREKIMECLEWCLPKRIPFLWDRRALQFVPCGHIFCHVYSCTANIAQKFMTDTAATSVPYLELKCKTKLS